MTTVVRIRGSATDNHGDPVGDDVRTTLPGCFMAPSSSNDIDPRGRQGVVVRQSIYGPFGTDLVHTDVVEVDGLEYELDGDPAQWKSPLSGWEAGFEQPIKRAAG